MSGPLSGRQRMLMAFSHQEADHVPVSPDISAMVPIRLSGKPFDTMFLDGQPHNGYASASVAQAYIDAVKYYGMDAWYIYGSMKEISPPDRPRWNACLKQSPKGGQEKVETAHTRLGDLSRKSYYPTTEPPWELEKPVKDLRRDWPRLRLIMGEDENWQWETTFMDRERLEELGVYSVAVGIPQDWWFFQRQGGYNTIFFDYSDDAGYIDEVFEFYSRYALERIEAACIAGADEIMLGGSASSLSASSLRNFRKYDLPFIRQAAEICIRYAVFSHLHVCGRSRKAAEMAAEETRVDVIEPLEEPPGGDVDIADFKRRFGQRVCLKGNLNTFDFMLNATPKQVEEKARRLIDECAAGGGFILSTGDQCGRDTPDANLFKLVEVAQTYGKY